MEGVRLVEDTALKAAGVNAFAGSIPVPSVSLLWITQHIALGKDLKKKWNLRVKLITQCI